MKNNVDKDLKLFKKYIDSYCSEHKKAYRSINKDVIIFDILYGLGLFVDNDKYRFYDGFDNFKKELIKMLSKQNIKKYLKK